MRNLFGQSNTGLSPFILALSFKNCDSTHKRTRKSSKPDSGINSQGVTNKTKHWAGEGCAKTILPEPRGGGTGGLHHHSIGGQSEMA